MQYIRQFYDFMVFLAFALVLAWLATFVVGMIDGRAWSQTTEPWDKSWNKDGDKFKSAGDGVKAGKGWCLNPKNKCATSIPKRLAQRWKEYCPDENDIDRCWWKKYAGGLIPAHLALTSVTEAPTGPSSCSPDSHLKECGLLGIKLTQAEKCECNVCDPECSIACASAGGNARRLAMMKRYPQLEKAPAMDQYVIGGLAGGIGQMAVTIIEKSGALAVKDDGALKWASPYKRMLSWWGSSRGKSPDVMEKVFIGRLTEYKIGFRIARPLAVVAILQKFYDADDFEGLPRGQYADIKMHAHFPPYPGDSKHGKCELWPELVNHLP